MAGNDPNAPSPYGQPIADYGGTFGYQQDPYAPDTQGMTGAPNPYDYFSQVPGPGQGPELPQDHPLAQHDVLPHGGPHAHPGFIDFLRGKGQDPHDTALAAAILARSVTHPDEALQWALQLKERREQQATRLQYENARTEAMKQRLQATQQQQRINAVERDHRTRFSAALKLMAKAHVSPDEYIKQGGRYPSPNLSPEENEDIVKGWEGFAGQKDTEAAGKAEASKNLNNTIKNVLRGAPPPPELADNPQVMGAVETFKERNTRAENRNRIASAVEARRAAMPTKTPEDKAKADRAKTAQGQINILHKDIERYQDNIDKLKANYDYVNGQPGDATHVQYDKMISDYEDKINKATTERNKWIKKVPAFATLDTGDEEASPDDTGEDTTTPAPTPAPANDVDSGKAAIMKKLLSRGK